MNQVLHGLTLAALSLLCAPAFAAAVAVPEPGTMSLVAGTVTAAVLAHRLRKK